jgi:hypothetical protein
VRAREHISQLIEPPCTGWSPAEATRDRLNLVARAHRHARCHVCEVRIAVERDGVQTSDPGCDGPADVRDPRGI